MERNSHLTNDESGRLATAKATRVGPAVISQGYGQSYSATDPAWAVPAGSTMGAPGASMDNLERVTDVTGTTDYGYQGDRATTLTGALTASIAYDFAGRAAGRVAAGLEVEGFVHDTLDRLTQVRRSGALSEILEYAPTGEPVFRKLGTQAKAVPNRGPSFVSSDVRTGPSVCLSNYRCNNDDLDLRCSTDPESLWTSKVTLGPRSASCCAARSARARGRTDAQAT